jgi:uncharacterized delta-60 repeat protein
MAKIYGQLENAQLENKASNYASGVIGRVWINTTDSKIYADNGTVVRPFLLNDDKIVIGNNGTPANNVRIHRGANGRLQLLPGDDNTAEGSMGLTLSELASICERYTDITKPALSVANAGRIIFLTDLNKFVFNNATGTAWADLDTTGGGGSTQVYRFNVNGKLSALGTSSLPKKRLDGAVLRGSFTPSACRVSLDTQGKTGQLRIDLRSSQKLDLPVQGIDAQFQSRIGTIANILPAQATQSISRATAQIATQSISYAKAAIDIDRILVEDGAMRVLLNGAFDSDWAVGDSILIAGSQNAANNGTFTVTQLGTPQFPNSLLLANASAVAERYSGGNDQISYLANLGVGSNAIVTSQYVYPDGRVLLGGTFTTWAGVARNRLVRLNADGTVDTTFATNIGTAFSVGGADINSIGVLSDGRIVIGGIFTTFNATTRNRLVVLNANGTEDTAFYTNMGTAFGGNVWTVLVQADDKIVVSGAFTTFNALTRNRIIRLNSNGTEDTTFYTNLGTGLSTATNGALVIREQADNKLILGGDFTAVNAVTRNRLVRLNSDGTVDGTFYTNMGTAFGGQVNGVAIQADGKILVGGAFTTFNGLTRNYLIRLNSDGTEDTTFYLNIGTTPNALVRDVTVRSSDQKIFVVGDFTTIAGQTVNRIVVLQPSGNPDRDWLSLTGTGFGTSVYMIRHDSAGDVYVCGSFAAYQVSTSLDFVKIKANGVLTKGRVRLQLFSFNYLSPVDASFAQGELFLSAGHSSANNNGNLTIYKTNQGGNNIWVKKNNSVEQAAPAGTADVFRWSYNLGALPSTDFAVGDQLKAASHTTAANNGNFPIRALTATAIVVYNVAGVVQAGVAGTCNTNRWQYELSENPSTASAVQVGDTIRFANCPVAANNGTFVVKQVNRGSTFNLVVENTTGAAQTTGGVGEAISAKKVVKFASDQSGVFGTSSFVEFKYLEDANFLGENKVYQVLEVNRGGGANYNIVIEEAAANRQVQPQGLVAVESRSLFATVPTIVASPVSTLDASDVFTQDFSGNLAANALAAGRYISLWILENYTDASATDLTVVLS